MESGQKPANILATKSPAGDSMKLFLDSKLYFFLTYTYLFYVWQEWLLRSPFSWPLRKKALNVPF